MIRFNRGTSRSRRIAAGMAAGAVVATAALGAAWTPASAAGMGTATVTPADHLKEGDVVTYSVAGFPANTMVAGVQCDQRVLDAGDKGYCNTKNAAIVTTDASGAASGTFTVHSGAGFISDNAAGKCDAQTSCFLVFTTPTLPAASATNAIGPVEFGSISTTQAGRARVKVQAPKRVKFMVKVGSAVAGVPTGSLVVLEGDKVLKTKTVWSSGVSAVTLKLAKGKHKIRFEYSGDTAYLPSADAVTVTVKPKPKKHKR